MRDLAIFLGSFAACLSCYAGTWMFGTPTCERWTTDNLESRRDLYSWVAPSRNRAWLAGFLSGSNLAIDDVELLSKIDMSVAVDYVDRHCKKNPKDDAATAATALLRDLIKSDRVTREKRQGDHGPDR